MNLITALAIVNSNPTKLLLKPANWGDEGFCVEDGGMKYIPTPRGGEFWMTYDTNTLLGEWVVADWDFKEIKQ